jgi:hypothetical protein
MLLDLLREMDFKELSPQGILDVTFWARNLKRIGKMPPVFYDRHEELRATIEDMIQENRFFSRQLASLMYDIVEIRSTPYGVL